MNGTWKHGSALGWMLLASVVSLGGCSQLRVPAIDQSGERIFAPTYTTINTPRLGSRGIRCFPEPAFTTPPLPPPCPPDFDPDSSLPPPCPEELVAEPPAAAPAARAPEPEKEGHLIVAPGRLVAPVGSEVVLTAGYCNAEGYYVTRQKIEWLLSQNSAGHFVDVSRADRGMMRRVLHETRGKLSGDYAITQTAGPQVVTRGTPTPMDDVLLDKGQTWISLTSQTEGTSHVTVVAPDMGSWPSRRGSATIHWVDAQWQLPSTTIVPAGQQHALTTTVTRGSGAVHTPPWLVRYEVVGGASASFAPDRQSAIEVPTDSQGRATAQLAPQSPQSGVTQVKIQIIRPPRAGDDLQRTVVGEGWTSITWSAPGLTVAIGGPQTAALNSSFDYRIDVSNPGDMTTSDVVVKLQLPATGLNLVSSTPTAEVFGQRVQWRLGDLAAKQTRSIDLRCRSTQSGDLRLTVEASGGSLRADSTAATRIVAPAMSLKMDGPDQAKVGDEVQYQIEVLNVGDTTLTNLTATDSFGDGLEHKEKQASPIVKQLGNLAPGESRKFAVTFIVRQAGQWRHALVVSSEGRRATAEATLTAESAPPVVRLEVTKTGPPQRKVNEQADYVITLRNAGNVPLTNLRVLDQHPDSLNPTVATQGFERTPGQLTWLIPRLEAGDTHSLQMNCLCVSPAAVARNRVSVTCDQQSQPVTAESLTTIVRDPAAQTPSPPPTVGESRGGPSIALPPSSGKLVVRLYPMNNPITVGATALYRIGLENDRDTTDQDIQVTIYIPEGLKYKSFNSRFAGEPEFKENYRVMTIPPVAELRQREKLSSPFELVVTGVEPGSYRLKVEVTSRKSPDPVVVSTETQVNR